RIGFGGVVSAPDALPRDVHGPVRVEWIDGDVRHPACRAERARIGLWIPAPVQVLGACIVAHRFVAEGRPVGPAVYRAKDLVALGPAIDGGHHDGAFAGRQHGEPTVAELVVSLRRKGCDVAPLVGLRVVLPDGARHYVARTWKVAVAQIQDAVGIELAVTRHDAFGLSGYGLPAFAPVGASIQAGFGAREPRVHVGSGFTF